jgi:hypothetical protein
MGLNVAIGRDEITPTIGVVIEELAAKGQKLQGCCAKLRRYRGIFEKPLPTLRKRILGRSEKFVTYILSNPEWS